jgi:hypothetical protein
VVGEVRLLGERTFDVLDRCERHAEIVGERARLHPVLNHTFDVVHSIRLESVMAGIEAFAEWVRLRT